jgi:hypothetical protein
MRRSKASSGSVIDCATKKRKQNTYLLSELFLLVLEGEVLELVAMLLD